MELSSDPAQLLQQGAVIKGQKTRYFNVFVRSMESFEKEGPTGASWGILQDAKEKYEDGALLYTTWCSTVYDVCAAAAYGTVVDRDQRLAAIAKEQTKFETQDAAVHCRNLVSLTIFLIFLIFFLYGNNSGHYGRLQTKVEPCGIKIG